MRAGRAALAVIGTELVFAASIGLLAFAPAHARADVPPTCDQTVPSACRWAVEHDGTTSELKACVNEDGNVDGLPCLWFDDGKVWYVDSANYREVAQ